MTRRFGKKQHSSKNIIICQKTNKISFLCVTKKLISFVHHNVSIFSFYITHWQHVDLLHSGPENKETFNPTFTHLSHMPKQLLSKAKLLAITKGLYFRKGAGLFLANFVKINTATGIFKDFTQILSNFLLHAIFPEDFPIADPVNFKISFQ